MTADMTLDSAKIAGLSDEGLFRVLNDDGSIVDGYTSLATEEVLLRAYREMKRLRWGWQRSIGVLPLSVAAAGPACSDSC